MEEIQEFNEIDIKNGELPIEYNGNEVHNFTTKIHLACCKKDELRENLKHIYFLNNYIYATNAEILIKQSLDLHFVINKEKLEGKILHRDNFENLLKFKCAIAYDDYILGISGSRKAKFIYSKDIKAPDFEKVIPIDKLEAIKYIGVNYSYINIAGKLLHGTEHGIKISFRGQNRGMVITSPDYSESEQLVLVMPKLLQDNLYIND